jgi:hypothetical protein
MEVYFSGARAVFRGTSDCPDRGVLEFVSASSRRP